MPALMPRATTPTRLSTVLEVRAPLDWATLALRAPSLATAPRGDGRPVMLIPGYGADEKSMKPLGGFLKYLGYDVHQWGNGRNRGNVEADIVHVGERAQQICEARDGEPVTLIGWSLGGVSAREAARLFERSVREVITLGTPIIGGPKYTVVGKQFAASAGMDLNAFEKEVHERNSIGIKQPVTSIYSKGDGVVGWQASVDVYNRQARNIEVKSSHMGLGGNARVWQIIARLLAEK